MGRGRCTSRKQRLNKSKRTASPQEEPPLSSQGRRLRPLTHTPGPLLAPQWPPSQPPAPGPQAGTPRSSCAVRVAGPRVRATHMSGRVTATGWGLCWGPAARAQVLLLVPPCAPHPALWAVASRRPPGLSSLCQALRTAWGWGRLAGEGTTSQVSSTFHPARAQWGQLCFRTALGRAEWGSGGLLGVLRPGRGVGQAEPLG